ncbi:hypothetical protein [Herbihabitans rhizosphaerae]|uniref:hypothetical protein n=1 Tax=Herbihabitans rhizosphaerae TaxID=1872711 RepID=UPI00102BF864|nr:hypothetical protein [Herbihabitans rhizosphaerae]
MTDTLVVDPEQMVELTPPSDVDARQGGRSNLGRDGAEALPHNVFPGQRWSERLALLDFLLNGQPQLMKSSRQAQAHI